VRWTEVTEEGFRGGPVMPDNYDGSAAATEKLRANIARAGIVGSLVGNDFKSTMLVVPLLDIDPTTGQRIDYRALSHAIEKIRDRVEADGSARVHVIGFAKLVGDLIDGLMQVALYFGLAALIAAVIIWLYTRCLRSTALVIACSLVAVVWQLGLVAAFGFELDPYSILVPVPRLRDRRQPRRAEDERHHVGHRPRRAPAGRRALHLPAPLPRRLTRLLADAVGFAC
jgi:predicted RND superfamily exporter protein